MAVYQDNAAGVTSTIGTDDYLVTGGIEQYGPMIGVLTDGEVYPYYIAFIDVADGADYETGQGTWDSGTNTLVRTTIETSSNSGAAVNWGVGQKALWIVQDASLATDMDQMRNGSSKFYLTAIQAANIAASKTKTDLITVTVPANLDTMQAQIAAITTGITYRGNWDASTGVFPGGGTGHAGDYWYCNVTGVVDTISFEAGDSIIALVANASISTFSGNWAKQDSFDSVQSVAGLVGTITGYDLAAAIPVNQPFSYKPEGEPILILAFGDSNMGGIGGSDPTIQTADSNVFVRATLGVGPYSTANLDWRNVDPNAAIVTDYPPAASAPYLGILRASNGSTAFGLATALRQITGRQVYVISAFLGGVTNAYWQPGGGAGKEGMTTLLAQIPLALADMPFTPDFFDVVYMSGGGNDCGTGVKAATFISTWQTMYDEMVSQGWVDPQYTQWFQGEIPQEYTAYAAGWTGLDALQAAMPSTAQVVSSIGLLTADGVHFTPYALNYMAELAANASVARLLQSSVQRNVFRAESTIADGATAIAHRLDTSAAYATAGAKYLQLSTAGTEKFSFGVGNIIRGDQTNNTPLVFRMSADSGYDLSYTANNAALFEFTSLNSGGPKGAWYGSRMSAGAGFPAFRFLAENSLTGTSDVIQFGHAGKLDCLTVSRTGLVTAGAGVAATGPLTATTGTFSGAVSGTTGTFSGAVSGTTGTFSAAVSGTSGTFSTTLGVTGATTLSSTLAVTGATTLSGRESINLGTFTSNSLGTSVFSSTFDETRNYTADGNHGITQTGIIRVASGGGTSATYFASETIRNSVGYAALVDRRGFYSNINYIADTTASVFSLNTDMTSAPVYSRVSGGTMLWTMIHFAAAGTNGAGCTSLGRAGFLTSDMTNSGTVSSQAGFVSNITSSGASSNTHLLMGTSTFPPGNFGICQSDTFVNRFNSGIISPWRGQSGTTSAVSVKGDRNIIFANGSALPGTVTLPTLTSMTTGHTAAQMSGYELVIINDRAAPVVSGTDFLLGAGTSFGFAGTCSILAKDSRTFIWNGVDTWL
jgi:hypothetical protein